MSSNTVWMDMKSQSLDVVLFFLGINHWTLSPIASEFLPDWFYTPFCPADVHIPVAQSEA
eukprot:5090672-Karenia_brevis.AAC.1